MRSPRARADSPTNYESLPPLSHAHAHIVVAPGLNFPANWIASLKQVLRERGLRLQPPVEIAVTTSPTEANVPPGAAVFRAMRAKTTREPLPAGPRFLELAYVATMTTHYNAVAFRREDDTVDQTRDTPDYEADRALGALVDRIVRESKC